MTLNVNYKVTLSALAGLLGVNNAGEVGLRMLHCWHTEVCVCVCVPLAENASQNTGPLVMMTPFTCRSRLMSIWTPNALPSCLT